MKLFSTAVATAIISFVGHIHMVHAHKASMPKGTNPSPRHRKLDSLNPDDNIIEYLNQQHAAGVPRAHFTLVGVIQNDNTTAVGGVRERSLVDETGTTSIYSIDVIEANPSVTPSTVISFSRGSYKQSISVADYGVTNQNILVAANHDKGDFVLLSVDGLTNQVEGMSKKAGEDLVKVSKAGTDALTIISQVEEFVIPEDWSCGFDENSSVDDEEDAFSTDGRYRRRTMAASVVDGNHHDHDHDEHHHDHDHGRNLHTDILAQLKSDLGDHASVHSANIGKRSRRALYPTDNFPQLYSYVVDFFIEIDNVLVTNNGGEVGAIEYVNDLVSAASAIYEREIDTHLNVAEIFISTVYDGADVYNAETGLNKMTATYAANTWHYTAGHGIDLHHALIGKNLSGGRATRGGICNPQTGFGISGGVVGTITDIGPMYWDLYVFAHEVGHNFGAVHTHDDSRIPKVDTCGVKVGVAYQCPPAVTVAGSATIMSYCHLCGGLAAIGLTFGGSWTEDDRTKINNWRNDANIGLFNEEPRRVPKGMWEDVSTRTCTSPNSIESVPKVSCNFDTDCFDGNSCTDDTCNTSTNQCVNIMRGECCGNFVCEANELFTSCTDCGPFVLGISLPAGVPFYLSSDIMFNVEAIGGIFIDGLTFYPQSTTGALDVYTISGGWEGSPGDLGVWDKIIDGGPFAAPGGAYSETPIRGFAPIEVSAGSKQGFYIALRSGTFARGSSSADTINSDLKILNPGSSGASFYGSVSYKITESIFTTASPSKAPSSNPTTSPSTASPSKSPTDSPTNSPTEPVPTSSPTVPQPSKSPSANPTNAPSKSPSTSPSSSPTPLPTSNPSKLPSASPTSPECLEDADCNDGNVCSTDTCNAANQCVYTWTDDCCGNYVCEAGEYAACIDCGTFFLDNSIDFAAGSWKGMMFNVEAIHDIVITHLYFRPWAGGDFNVNFYMTPDGFVGKERAKSSWTLLSSETITVSEDVNAFEALPVLLQFTEINLRAGSVLGFYVSTDKYILGGDIPEYPVAQLDQNLKVLNPARAIISTEFSGGEDSIWIGGVGYKKRPPSCELDSDCFINDFTSCTVDTCNTDTSQCATTITRDCCGNSFCEANELSTCSNDCGPFSLEVGLPSSTNGLKGIMFNVEAIEDVTIQSLKFYTSLSNPAIDVFIAPDGYAGKEQNQGAWTSLVTTESTSSHTFWRYKTTISFDGISLSAGSTLAFYVASTNDGHITAIKATSAADPAAIDDKLKILQQARSVFSTQFGWGREGYSWVGVVSYKLPEGVFFTASPSKAPTMSPTTSPSASPSSNPSKAPSSNPTTSPSTASPSKSPTTNPTNAPTEPVPTNNPTVPQPSKSPSTNPTNAPSKSPSLSPTNAPTTASPSSSPTHLPTSNPSKSPSVNPTAAPSKSPTDSPSNNPTTVAPSRSPSTSPSNAPTLPQPSTSPTSSPTKNPSKSPTASPLTPECAVATVDNDCDDGNDCSIYTCETVNYQCVLHSWVDNCCGNNICETGEFASCSDCGPFSLEVGLPSSTYGLKGIMFNVEAIEDVIIQSLKFYTFKFFGSSPEPAVDVFTAPDGYDGKEQNQGAWTSLVTTESTSSHNYAHFKTTISFDGISLSAGSTLAFYVASTNDRYITAIGETSADPAAIDDKLKILQPARSVYNGQFGPGDMRYSWVGVVSYKLPEEVLPTLSPTLPPTTSPTVPQPSSSPTTAAPSKSPSANPTNAPTEAPSRNPTNSPSANPTNAPTAAPSSNPTNPPSANPTNAPTAAPSSNPTNPPTEPLPTASPTNSPTSNPSKSPSASPTSSPTNPLPTTNPSISPTSNPSKMPSASPTNAPTTASPTTSPTTANPTSSPTTARPTSPPTQGPTQAPATPPPTTSPITPLPTQVATNRPTDRPTPPPQHIPPAVVTTTCRGRCLWPECGIIRRRNQAAFAAAVQSSLMDLICPRGLPCTLTATVIIDGVPTVTTNTRFGLRLLRALQDETHSDIEVEYEVNIETPCNDASCLDAEDVAISINNQVTEQMTTAVEDGSLIESIAEATSDIAEVIETVTATIKVSPVELSIPSIFTKWYPDWEGESETCLNDGLAPFYMERNGGYYEPSLDACCERYFSWDFSTCSGNSKNVPIGFYPNWGNTETKCLNSTVTAATLPDYMRQNSEQWLVNDIESCCERHYNWVYFECINLSGGSSTIVASEKWYVNHQKEICQKDCIEGENAQCGGLANTWNTLYEDATSCCEENLSWIVSSLCVAQSDGTSVVGTSQWYVDWAVEKCVKDCDDKSDASCGGVAEKWDEVYPTSNDCCDRLWYIARAECTDE